MPPERASLPPAECGLPRYLIGIDTGGTYTDAVILDPAANRVLATAKRPTTHGNLPDGIGAALAALLEASGADPRRVELAAVSSTLATNAVVEDKRAAVGLILIGFPEYVDLPAEAVKYVRGGHTLQGAEQEPLDVEALADAVEDLRARVDAYAVGSLMSVVNPSHELVAARSVGMPDAKPVFCSHQISGKFGLKERAATTLINAGLVPVMQQFLDSVESSLRAAGIAAPVMVVRGDARAVEAAGALSAPATTVMSGPAASAYFGARNRNGPALVVDVGGTTTDICCLVEDGLPVVTVDGSLIGRWQTHVNTVESFTVGVGGDSAVWVHSSSLGLSAERVRPLALHPELSLSHAGNAATADLRVFLAAPGCPAAIAAQDAVLRHLLEGGPATADELRAALSSDLITILAHLKTLKRHQLVLGAGFTPTDALRVLGRVELGSRQPALEGARILASRLGLAPEQFCEDVLAAARRKISDSILTHVIRREVGLDLEAFLARRSAHRLLDVRLRLNVPLIGIGAASPHLLAGAGETLGVDVVFPEHYEVGNALGAALMGLEAARAFSAEPGA